MKKFIRKWHKPSVPGATKEPVYVTSAEVRQIISKQLGAKLGRSCGIYLADGEYFCPPVKDATEIISASAVDRYTYVKLRFDCDDFALVLKAHFCEAAYKNGQRRAPHCFGIVWGSLPGPHAINWMINDDKILRFVEPQNDTIFLPRGTDKGIYFMLA